MEVHSFTESGSIEVTIGGVRMWVPNDPANRHRQMIAEWEAEGNTIPAYAEPPPTPAQIKAECRRRILLLMTEDQQRNSLAAHAAASMQYGSDPSNWPSDLQARQASAMVVWAEIERLRARSNEIEAMAPMPEDVAADELWAAG